MSLSIYTYSNPYEIHNEPYWDSIKNCAHFCVSQTMVNGLTEVYSELNCGQVTTVENLVKCLYPKWFDTKTYIEQYTIITNILDSVSNPKISEEAWNKAKQSLKFNKGQLLESIRLLRELDVLYENIRFKKLNEEQKYLAATYKTILNGPDLDKFTLKKNFSESEIDEIIKTTLLANEDNGRNFNQNIDFVDCDTVIIHGVHQFTPTILSTIEELQKYKRVVLLFNYQSQYKEVYQTWLDVYSCFDINIKSQFNNEFKPSKLLSTSYAGNVLADNLACLADGDISCKDSILENIGVIEFDNVTEFSSYVAKRYEEAKKNKELQNSKGSVLSFMSEQFYAANSSVNDILKVYFPEQFGERHFLAYPIGHFFVAVTNMWDPENGGIKITDLNDIAECLYSGALPEKEVGTLITTFNSVKNYVSRATTLEKSGGEDGIINLLTKLKKQKSRLTGLKNSAQLERLSYFNVDENCLDELIDALNILNSITKIFYEDFENKANNFQRFYEKIKEFVEQQVLPTVETETEFYEIITRLLSRLEDMEEVSTTSSFDCLKETMAYYLKQESGKGESANWIVRDFQQIDGDVLKSSNQDPNTIYHFACLSDEDMNMKREDQFPWPLDIEFFDRAYDPLDWKYQVYIKSRKEHKHFKRYALIYGLEFNRCKFKLSYVKNDDDKENELYYMLKLLDIKSFPYQYETPDLLQNEQLLFELGNNKNKFTPYDVFRRRICGYRFALESLINGGSKYKDRFLQYKYFEIILENAVVKELAGHEVSAEKMDKLLDEKSVELNRYFRFLNESELTDIKSSVKHYIYNSILRNGKLKRFPEISAQTAEYMKRKEEFIYLRLDNKEDKNVLHGKFFDLTDAEKRSFTSSRLKEEKYTPSVDIWCQWCAEREICLEFYKSPIAKYEED